MALCRFLRPSESGLTMGYWEPVSTTGISISLSIKESIDAVYAIVSVPWVITMPEQLSRAFITALAICCHSSGCMFELSIWNRSVYSILCPPGTYSSSSFAPSPGISPLGEGTHAMVPPVAMICSFFIVTASEMKFFTRPVLLP